MITLALLGMSIAGPGRALAATDPDLEPGFPARAYSSTGTFGGGPGVDVTVGDVDRDPALEVFVSAQAEGPVMGWDADGSELPGWPPPETRGHAQVALGDFSRTSAAMEVFT